jgi:hypothetical protein
VKCRDFNDKMQWLKLFDQDPEIIRCSDKIMVRDYVKELVGEQYLTALYQTAERFEDIDLESLPSAFVIKANHDSGTVILVRDKSELDRLWAKGRIDAALSRPYGWENGEWAYSYIEPRILIEEYLDQGDFRVPPDYKFYCVNGVVKFCHYISDRDRVTQEQIIDAAGFTIDTDLYPTFKRGSSFVKPDNWQEMIEIAERIAGKFKYVRVDLFNINNRIIVGEMTFWPMAGAYKSNGQRALGQLIDFDRVSFKPPILHKIKKPVLRFIQPKYFGHKGT